MKTRLHFIGISASLRKGSFNTMLLNAAAGLLPEGVTIEIVSIADIPNYNASQKFDANGNLTYDTTKDLVKKKLHGLKELILQLRPPGR